MFLMLKDIMNKKNILSILDSKLILTTPKYNLYNIKLVECGDYVIAYQYKDKRMRKNSDCTDLCLRNKVSCTCDIEERDSKEIANRNVMRSKLECQRLAKCNLEDWKSFITLTFADNISDLEYANKRFRLFVDKIQRVKKDFKYLCIPEFQKRGATHYHLLTNISIDDTSLIFAQEDNKKFKHIKYWIDGFTTVEPLLKCDSKKVIGYISKYMTKDIDNRLFNRHRYFYSRNLKKPIVSYIDTDKVREKDFYTKKIQDTSLIYENEYLNPYDNSEVVYLEFLKDN